MRPKKPSTLTLNTLPTVEIWNMDKQLLANQQCAAASFLKQDSCLFWSSATWDFFRQLHLVITTGVGFWLGFFPFLWFSTAPNPGLKLQELVLLQLVSAAPVELAVAMGPALQSPAPASFGEGGAEEEIWHPESRSSQSCLSLEVSPKCQC